MTALRLTARPRRPVTSTARATMTTGPWIALGAAAPAHDVGVRAAPRARTPGDGVTRDPMYREAAHRLFRGSRLPASWGVHVYEMTPEAACGGVAVGAGAVGVGPRRSAWSCRSRATRATPA